MSDESEVRRCKRVDCRGEDDKPREGKWFVVLLLVPSRGYTGKPWRLQTNIVVCDEHRDYTAASYITEDSWKLVLEHCDQMKQGRPHRSSTRADFVAIPGTAAVQ